MRLLDKYFQVLRSPDEPAAPELELEPVVEPAPDPAPEPTPEPEPQPAPVVQERMVPLKVMLERVGEETSKRQAAEDRARQSAERESSLQEIMRRMQSEPKPAGEPKPEPARPAAPATDATAVDQAAAQMLLQRDMRNVSDAGAKAYGSKWSEAVGILDAFKLNTVDFVSNVMEIDPARTHELMFDISQDPQKAGELSRMTPARRISEITRMVMAKTAAATIDPKPAADAKPAPTKISQAPAPKPAIAPLAAAPEVDPTTPEGNEKMSDSQWSAWYKNKYMKRSA